MPNREGPIEDFRLACVDKKVPDVEVVALWNKISISTPEEVLDLADLVYEHRPDLYKKFFTHLKIK